MTSRPRKSEASEAARLLAKLGARKGGKASAAALSPEERRERARAAVVARWEAANGDKLTKDQERVIARLNKDDPTELPISDGQAGRRRRAAMYRLAQLEKLRIISDSVSSISAILL